jgi:hypothetical protein
MILSICSQQVNDTSFVVYNNTSQQLYTESGINLATVTTATLTFSRVNEEGDVVTTDISLTFQYLFESGGLTIDFTDFGEDLINGLDYFADALYTISISYVYDGNLYTASTTVGFKARINNIVIQMMIQSNWKKELSCSCACDPYNSVNRRWEYLYNLDLLAELCLISEYELNLKSLYKLTGTEYELE